MSVPVISFFDNKGGVGKTSLVYHISCRLSELDESVVVFDLDPQANLTSSFFEESRLKTLFESPNESTQNIYGCTASFNKRKRRYK